MAGIGFKLTKYFSGKNVWDNLKGVLYSTIISSGPWLISVVSVFFVGIFAQKMLLNHDLYVFKCVISYTFAASLIVFGFFEMPLTRYLADRLYMSDISTFRSVFISVETFAIIITGIIGYTFYYFFDWGIILKLVCIALFSCILTVWICMIFLSASKNYQKIVMSFLLGGVTSFVLALFFGKQLGLLGYLLGYTLGQFITALLLAQNVFSEYMDFDYSSLDYLNYFNKYRSLVMVGLSYYLAIWVDKFFFWYSEVGVHVEGLFYTNQYYDTAMFLSYITIVPSFAVFIVQVETDFYINYSYYYRSIENKNDLNFLEHSVDEIVLSLKKTIKNLLKIQTFITLLCWYFADYLIKALFLPSMMLSIFRYGAIGAYLQVLFIIVNIVLLYFEERRYVLISYFTFLVTNALFSFFSIKLGFRYHGLGYLLSCLVTFTLSILFLRLTLKKLNYITFMKQPMSKDNFVID